MNKTKQEIARELIILGGGTPPDDISDIFNSLFNIYDKTRTGKNDNGDSGEKSQGDSKVRSEGSTENPFKDLFG